MTTLAFLIPTLFLGLVLGFWLCNQFLSTVPFSPSEPRAPQVIINVPADFKPIESLPPTAIEGAKASLWYTVYKATLDDDQCSVDSCIAAADAAVTKVFGS